MECSPCCSHVIVLATGRNITIKRLLWQIPWSVATLGRPAVGRRRASTSVDRRLQLAGLAGEELPGFECNIGVARPGVAANIDPDVLGGFFTIIEGQASTVGDVAAGGGQ